MEDLNCGINNLEVLEWMNEKGSEENKQKPSFSCFGLWFSEIRVV